MQDGAAAIWEAISIHEVKQYITMNVSSIKRSSLDFMSIIKTEPAVFPEMETIIY